MIKPRVSDEQILQTISEMDEFPSSNSISLAMGKTGLKIGNKTVSIRFKSNANLAKKADERTFFIINNTKIAELLEKVNSGEWNLGKISKANADYIYARIDGEIRKTIREMDELPNPSSVLSVIRDKGLKIGGDMIYFRFKSNAELRKAADDQSLWIIENVAVQKLFENINSRKWNIGLIPKTAAGLVYERMDSEILQAIRGMDDLPTGSAIARTMIEGGLSINASAISIRIGSNAELSKEVDKRALWIIENTGIEKLFENVSSGKWNLWYLKMPVFELAYSRIDAEILKTIQEMSEPITQKSISIMMREKGLKIDNSTIASRFKSNAELSKAADTQSLWVIENIGIEKLFENVSSGKWNLGTFSKPLAERAYGRIDGEILRIIREMDKRPNSVSISQEMGKKRLKLGSDSCDARIHANPTLFFAYYARHGMSEDQIVSLMMDRKADAPAMRAGLEKRLPHLEVFRESLAVQQFKETLFGREPKWILELSSYPAPLYEAGKFMEGKPVAVDSYSVKSALEQGILYADNSVPAVHISSSLPRIKDSEQMGRLFGEISRVLQDGGRAVFTAPTTYEMSASFDEQVQKAGLVVIEQGLRSTYLPQTEMNSAPKPILEKVSGDSRIVVLEKVGPAAEANLPIDPLIRQADGQNGNGTNEKAQAMTLDVPDGINQQLAHAYSKEAAYSDALMLSVLDKGGKLAEVFGYNMNPKRPFMLEHEGAGKAMNANEAEKIKILVSQAMKEPGKPGAIPIIRPGKDTAVRADALKRMI